LKESEERYHQVLESMIFGFALYEIIIDENDKPFDYRFLEMNPLFEHITGLNAEKFKEHTVLEMLPDTELYWIETCGRIALQGGSFRFETYNEDLQQHFEVTIYSPMIGKFATVFQDITERKRAENAMRENSL
jgi:PAS domain S-box-containing protein